ncbi:hypothetical protein N665_0318s0024 [Sinapis alba]|nr:hypothetical protein N665_0318s0024 [Sinapis alba]
MTIPSGSWLQKTRRCPWWKTVQVNINELKEGNLDFWLRFITIFEHIQRYDSSIEDLQADVSKLTTTTKKKQDRSSTSKYALRSNVRPL